MKFKGKFIAKCLLILSLITCLSSFSQVKITGVVKDNLGAISSANVVLTTSENEFKQGVVTNNDGHFEITTYPGAYVITVSFVGYKNWSKVISVSSDLVIGEIFLGVEELKEIVVKSKKKLVEYKSDKIIYNVENNISLIGGDAINAIKTAPGLIIQNGNISLLGKGASRIMINGRLIELTGDELVGYLSSIASNDIKNIEVINNPPSKYDAAGGGGLINIVLKKGVLNSWKNTSTLVYDQNTYNFFTLRNNFSYNKDKFKISFSTNGTKGDIRNKGYLDIYYPDGTWEIRGVEKQQKDNFSGRIAFDYDITNKTTFGIQYFGDNKNPNSNYNNTSKILNPDGSINSYLVNKGFNDVGGKNHTLNGHVITKLDTVGKSFSIDVDYFKFDSNTDNNFIAEKYSSDNIYISTDQSANNISDQKIENFSSKIDMYHPLKKVNLSYGGKISYVKSTSSIAYYNTITGTPVFDPNRSNNFEYEENNQALYIDGSGNINQKLSFQLGIRLENTQTEGFSKTLDQTNKNNYLKLFPTLYLTYTKNENNTFSFNYGRRINRPNFSSLNPFRVYINSNSYSEGNPFLQPSYGDNFDFTYNFKDKFVTNAFLNITTNDFGVVFLADTQTNTQIITRLNYNNDYYYGIGESYTEKINSWWESQNIFYLLGSKNKFTNNINAVSRNKSQIYFSTNNTFSFGKMTKLQVDYFYGSSYERGLYKFGFNSGLNLSFRQSFLKESLNLTFLINDIFNSAYLRDYTSKVNDVKQVYNENNSSRFFRLSLTYSFGNKKISVKQRDFGNQEERNRSRN